MPNEEIQFQFGTPKQEIDEPSDFIKKEDVLDTKKESNEKDKERKERRYFSAIWLIVGCLVFLCFIYIFETVVNVKFDGKVSNVTETIIETIKTLIFTLSGYLFAKKEGGD